MTADNELPTIDYAEASNPAEAHRIISGARARAPIAIGPYGPEVLNYELVRSVLRDPRFRMPQGIFPAAQGITSGPLPRGAEAHEVKSPVHLSHVDGERARTACQYPGRAMSAVRVAPSNDTAAVCD